MKNTLLMLAMLVLASSLSAFADSKVAAMPNKATVSTGQQIALEAFCNQAPCTLSWVAVLSNSNVGKLDATTGGRVTFSAGSAPGQAYIVVIDTAGNGATLVEVTVQATN